MAHFHTFEQQMANLTLNPSAQARILSLDGAEYAPFSGQSKRARRHFFSR